MKTLSGRTTKTPVQAKSRMRACGVKSINTSGNHPDEKATLRAESYQAEVSKQAKPKLAASKEMCDICGKGSFKLTRIEYQDDEEDSVLEGKPLIWVEKCTHCGEIIFPLETLQYIEEVAKESRVALSVSELKRIREEFGVDQSELSKILGLGAKTFHRWENGVQFPSRSMCYYIRTLAEFDDAFEWLRNRTWLTENRVLELQDANRSGYSFPLLEKSDKKNESGIDENRNCNFPKVFSTVFFK